VKLKKRQNGQQGKEGAEGRHAETETTLWSSGRRSTLSKKFLR